jgi:cbb3-type cytochrome oxidase maturation protein
MLETLYLLIPISVVLVFLIGIAFWWSLRNGQFDDLEGPAYRILMDDDRSPQTPPAGDVQPPGGRRLAASPEPGKSDPSAANLDDS